MWCLERYHRRPHLTRTVFRLARGIELKDKFEKYGAQMVKEVASKTSDVAATHHHRDRARQAIVREGHQVYVLPG